MIKFEIILAHNIPSFKIIVKGCFSTYTYMVIKDSLCDGLLKK